jgi:hypothetical protein
MLKVSLFSLLVSVILSSCTKVIEVDLNSKDPQYVIEGFVTLGQTTHQVSITKTLNIYESAAFPTVDNAIVTLSDDQGNSQNMVLTSSGIYQATAFPVVAGRIYTLSVSVDSKVFVASVIMPQDVQLDSIETFPFAFGPQVFNSIVPVRLDPAGIENYYQFQLLKNGKYIPGIYIQSDQFNDGNMMMEPIFADGANSGDTILVEMYGIDRTVHDYFYTLIQNDQGATPANPTSNFSGGCLGYLSVRTMDTMSVVIP